MKTRRRPSTPPPSAPAPAPAMPETLEEAQTQLRLARAQNAYLHRELARALKHGPMAPPDAAPQEKLALALQSLREHYAVLKLHYEDAQVLITQLKYSLAVAHQVMGWHMDDEQLALLTGDGSLDATLKHLLTLAHPDKWCQGQPATELAHELTQALNEARARLAPR